MKQKFFNTNSGENEKGFFYIVSAQLCVWNNLVIIENSWDHLMILKILSNVEGLHCANGAF